MVLQSVLSSNPIKDSFVINQVMVEVYETLYGIFNHAGNAKAPPSKRRPLASVAFHKGEDFTHGSLLEEVIETFDKYSIKDIFGYNFSEFMKLPVDVAELLIKYAKTKYERERIKKNDLINGIDKKIK